MKRTINSRSNSTSAARSTRGRANRHPGANDGIEHPPGHRDHYAGGPQHLEEIAQSLAAPPDARQPCCQNTGATGNGLPTPARHGQNERVMAIGRRNWLFAGSKAGGERAAAIYSIIETCKLNGVEPFAYISGVMQKIAEGWPNSRIDELMPWAWSPIAQQKAA